MNVEEYCRTCAHPNMSEKELKELFSTDTLKEVLKCLQEWQLGILEKDGLPQRVCEDCEEMLLRIYTFRKRTQQAQEYLELLFARGETPFKTIENTLKNARAKAEPPDAVEWSPPEFVTVEIAENTWSDHSKTHDDNIDEEMIEMDYSTDAEEDNGTNADNYKLDSIIGEKIKKRRKAKRHFQNRCAYCVYKDIAEDPDFPTARVMEEHVKNQHNDKERPYNCPYCTSKYQTRTGCMTHIKIMHLGKSVYCHVCKKDIKGDAGHFRHHVECNHTHADRKCDVCGKEFHNSTLYSLKYHQRWHNTNKVLKCEHCGRSFVRRAHLNAHLITHNQPDAGFLCTHCGKSLRSKWVLRAHLYARHGIGTAPISCDHCDKTFYQHSHKRLHMDRHHPEKIAEKQIECQICQKKFESESNLQRHLKFPHKPKDAAPKPQNYEVFVCSLCPRKFRAEYALTKHSEVHSLQGRPFPCDECDMSFKQPSLLKRHKVQKHSTLRPFVCTYCPKAFSNKSALKEHTKVHEVKEKKFECLHCKSKFKFEKSMMRHQLIHSNMTYSCLHCDKYFVKAEQLSTHINRYHKTHTTEQKDEQIYPIVEKKRKMSKSAKEKSISKKSQAKGGIEENKVYSRISLEKVL